MFRATSGTHAQRYRNRQPAFPPRMLRLTGQFVVQFHGLGQHRCLRLAAIN